MIYDAIERAHTVLLANFTTDLAAIITAKSLEKLDSTVTLYRREMAEQFADIKDGLPGIGIYVTTVATQAVWQTQRDSILAMVFDYYARHSDSTKLAQQVELAVEAMLRSVDRMNDSDVLDAGGAAESTLVLLTPVAEPSGMKFYERRATVSFPVRERDTGL